MDKKLNNADSTLAGDLQASNTTSMVVKTGEGALFGTVFPIEVTAEHYEGLVVTKRETITVTARSGDVLTTGVGKRASQICVQDESVDPKVRTQNALSFVSGDRVFIAGNTEKDNSDLITELDDINTELNTTIPATYATKEEVAEGDLSYDASSEGTDTYKVTITDINEYKDGMKIYVKSDVANTGACTVEINALGPIAVKNLQGTEDLTDGEWKANGIACLIYNSTGPVFQFSGQEASVVSVSSDNLKTDFTSGEILSTLNFFRSGVGTVINDLNLTTQWVDNNHALLASTTYYETGGRISLGGASRLFDITSNFIRIGSPVGEVNIEVYSDSGFSTLVATSNTINMDDINTGSHTFYFENITLSNATYYYKHNIVSGTISASNYLQTYYYTGGTGIYTFNTGGTPAYNASWSPTYEINTEYTGTTTETVIKKYKSSSVGPAKGSIEGLVISGVAIDTSFTGNISGLQGGFSGLTEGATYYLQDDGSVGLNIGTFEVKVGKAVSTTEIILFQGL